MKISIQKSKTTTKLKLKVWGSTKANCKFTDSLPIVISATQNEKPVSVPREYINLMQRDLCHARWFRASFVQEQPTEPSDTGCFKLIQSSKLCFIGKGLIFPVCCDLYTNNWNYMQGSVDEKGGGKSQDQLNLHTWLGLGVYNAKRHSCDFTTITNLHQLKLCKWQTAWISQTEGAQPDWGTSTWGRGRCRNKISIFMASFV